jgi:hypothetical protein
MKRTLTLWPEQTTTQNGHIQWQASLAIPGKDPIKLWYRMPLEQAPATIATADPFAIAAIFSAMRHADALHIHGTVSPSLLSNLQEFQLAWAAWHPQRYRVIELIADHEQEELTASTAQSVMAYSGGLDSTFSAWRHTHGKQWTRLPQPLTSALMVHGFDIPIAQPEVFARAAENSRQMLDSANLRLLTMATNFRELGDDWEEAHGAALFSALHFLKRSYGACMVASSHTYDTLRMGWGSNPITDTLLASHHYPAYHDGCGVTRRGKANAVSAWPQAMQHLRVCWEGPNKDRNCGVCLRCVGTAICFAVEGKPTPSSITTGDLATAIAALRYSPKLSPVAVVRLGELLAVAESKQINAPWVGALRQLIKQKTISPAGKLLRRITPNIIKQRLSSILTNKR